jgi:hypothetical protein
LRSSVRSATAAVSAGSCPTLRKRSAAARIGFKFFGYALAHHYIFGEHKPGRTDIWAAYEKARAKLPEAGAARGIGTPDQLRARISRASRIQASIRLPLSNRAVRTGTIILATRSNFLHEKCCPNSMSARKRGPSESRKSLRLLSNRRWCGKRKWRRWPMKRFRASSRSAANHAIGDAQPQSKSSRAFYDVARRASGWLKEEPLRTNRPSDQKASAGTERCANGIRLRTGRSRKRLRRTVAYRGNRGKIGRAGQK